MKKKRQLDTPSPFVIRDEDFALGVKLGRQAYEDEGCEETLTDGDVMQFIARCLSHEGYEHDCLVNAVLGVPPVSYSYHVGFVVGWLAALMAVGPTYVPTFSMTALLDAQRPTPNAVSLLVVS